MAVTISKKVDIRDSGAELSISGEAHVVGEDTVNVVQLYEVPLKESPSSVVIPGYVEVTYAPTATGEFFVHYTGVKIGQVDFHSGDNGRSVSVSYKGRGSAIFARDFNRFNDLVGLKAYNIVAYGAVADGKIAAGGAMTSGQPRLVTTDALFTSGDVGKPIHVPGAGASAAALVTTISSFVNNTTVDLAVNASTTVTGKRVAWGTDNKPVFDTVFDLVKESNGGIVTVPEGTYFYRTDQNTALTDETFTREASNLVLQGAGPKSVILVQGYIGLKTGNPRADVNRYAHDLTDPAQWDTPVWGQQEFKQIHPVDVGSRTVFVVTSGDELFVSPGDVVFIESGNGGPGTGDPPFNFEYNVVKSVEDGTDAITLEYPLQNSFNGDDPAFPPVIIRPDVIPPSNVHFRDLRIEKVPSSDNTNVLEVMGTLDMTMENCQIIGRTYPSFSERVRWEGCRFEGALHEIGDAVRFFRLRDNDVYADEQYGIRSSGALQHFYVEGNRVYDYSRTFSNSQGISVASHAANRPPRYVWILDNTVLLDTLATTGSGQGILLSDVQHVVVRGNKVIGKPSTAGVSGIQVYGVCHDVTLEDNEIHFTTNGSGIVLRAPLSGSGHIIEGVIVQANVLNVPETGILLAGNGFGGDTGTIQNVTIGPNVFRSVATKVGRNTTGTGIYVVGAQGENWDLGLQGLLNVKFLSGTSTAANNLRGSFTISESDTSVTVTFPTAEVDTNYKLIPSGGPVETTGTPAANSNSILKVVKATTGFTVSLVAAPGTGNSVTFDWALLR